MSAPTRRHRRGRFSLLPALSLLAAALAHGSALAAAQELAGVELRCCALVESPMVVKDTRGDETRFTGIAIDYLRKLELALGFRCKTLYEYGSDQAPAPDGFEGFTGFVKYIADCAKGNDTSSCMCDMGVSGIASTVQRFGLVDFVSPLNSGTFSVGQSVTSLGGGGAGWVIFRPFSRAVWMGVASVILMHIFVTLFDKEFASTEVPNAPPPNLSRVQRLVWTLTKTSLLRRVRLGFFSTAFVMVGHVSTGEETVRGRENRHPSARQKALSLVGLLMGVFLVISFEAGLVVQLFESRLVSRFRTINDFKSCRRLKAKDLCIPAGGASEGFWRQAVAYNGSERARDCPDDQPIWVTSEGDRDPYDESIRRVTSGEAGSCNFVLASTSTLQSAARGDFCGDFTLVGDPFYRINTGFVLAKGSRFTDPLSRETLMLHQQDFLESPLDVANQQKCDYGNGGTTQLNWSLLGIFFYVSWGTLLILLVLMIVDPGSWRNAELNDTNGVDRKDSTNSDASSDL